uniref:Uncharacterized protein n=1 Tax=Zea mays TaxID=4577 RepID=B7ZZF6_MAIZE|nr:unknown [Zea mays]
MNQLLFLFFFFLLMISSSSSATTIYKGGPNILRTLSLTAYIQARTILGVAM